jgi:hypothetical protein
LNTRELAGLLIKRTRLIVTIGVSDMVLVDTGDVLLVCPKEQSSAELREVVNILEK